MRWKLALVVINPDSAFYGGYFKVSMASSGRRVRSPPAC